MAKIDLILTNEVLKSIEKSVQSITPITHRSGLESDLLELDKIDLQLIESLKDGPDDRLVTFKELRMALLSLAKNVEILNKWLDKCETTKT